MKNKPRRARSHSHHRTSSRQDSPRRSLSTRSPQEATRNHANRQRDQDRSLPQLARGDADEGIRCRRPRGRRTARVRRPQRPGRAVFGSPLRSAVRRAQSGVSAKFSRSCATVSISWRVRAYAPIAARNSARSSTSNRTSVTALTVAVRGVSRRPRSPRGSRRRVRCGATRRSPRPRRFPVRSRRTHPRPRPAGRCASRP